MMMYHPPLVHKQQQQPLLLLFNFPIRLVQPKSNKNRPLLRCSLRLPPPLRIVNCSASAAHIKLKNKRRRNHNQQQPNTNSNNNTCEALAKPVALALFSVVVGFLCPLLAFRRPAFAAVDSLVTQEQIQEEEEENAHQYSYCTRRLLQVASRLVKAIDEARNSGTLSKVEEGLKEVKVTKKALQDEIMNALYEELRVLKSEKDKLMDRSRHIVDIVYKAKKDDESFIREERRNWEKEYSDTWDRIGEIDDVIAGTETMALGIGIRELMSIERECESLVADFLKEIRNRSTQSSSDVSVTKLSKGEIQKELQHAHRQLQEQIVLPSVLLNEDMGSLSDKSTAFALRIHKVLTDSREMQKNLEASIRKTMKKYGGERRLVVTTPPNEVVKGFPDIELKWVFGKEEVVVPKAAGLHLLHGWKKWREDTKMDLKRSFLEDSELGKKYLAERQERILLDRDRVASRAWYNEQQRRWELDPVAVPYAVSKKLVENARIRHDWGAMFITLKGNDKEYYVDIKEFEIMFEDFGGFDALYLRMLAAGIPTAVQLMWIPFSELDVGQQFLLVVTVCRQCITGLWSNRIVSQTKSWTLEKIMNINDDIMTMIIFPLVEFVIPYQVRMKLGMAWPEFSDVSLGSTWYLKWQSEAEINFKLRKRDGFMWYFWFVVRTAIYGYLLFHLSRFMKRKIPRVLGFGPVRRDPNFRKLRRVVKFISC